MTLDLTFVRLLPPQPVQDSLHLLNDLFLFPAGVLQLPQLLHLVLESLEQFLLGRMRVRHAQIVFLFVVFLEWKWSWHRLHSYSSCSYVSHYSSYYSVTFCLRVSLKTWNKTSRSVQGLIFQCTGGTQIICHMLQMIFTYLLSQIQYWLSLIDCFNICFFAERWLVIQCFKLGSCWFGRNHRFCSICLGTIHPHFLLSTPL